MAIRSLCVTEAVDRPTIATIIGMRDAGIDVTVVCPADDRNLKTLEDAGIPTVDIRLPTNFNKAGITALREELVRGRYHIMHTFTNKAVSNGLRACKGLPVKVVCYRGIVGAVGFLDPMSWMRYLNPRIDRIVCVCNAIRRHFLEMKPAFLRMPAERPVTIYKGHKLEWYTATPANAMPLRPAARTADAGATDSQQSCTRPHSPRRLRAERTRTERRLRCVLHALHQTRGAGARHHRGNGLPGSTGGYGCGRKPRTRG